MISRERNLIVSPENAAMPGPEPDPAGGGFGVREILYILFRHKWKIVFLAIVSMVVGFPVVLLQPETYQSTAKLMIKISRAPLSGFEGSEVPEEGAPRHDIAAMDVGDIMGSPDLARLVVDTMGPEKILYRPPRTSSLVVFLERVGLGGLLERLLNQGTDEPPPSDEYLRLAAQNTIQGGLSIKDRFNVVTVSYTAFDPRQAKSVLQAIIESYMPRHIAVHTPAIGEDFFKARAAAARKVLEQAQLKLETFRLKNNIISPEMQETNLLEQESNLQTRITEAGAALRASEQKIRVYEEQLAKLPRAKPAVRGQAPQPAAPARQESAKSLMLAKELRDLKKDKVRLEQRFLPGARELDNIANEIEATQKELDDELKQLETEARNLPAPVTEIVNGVQVPVDPQRQQIMLLVATEKGDQASHKAELGDLRGQLSTVRAELNRLARLGAEWAELSHTVAMKRELDSSAERAYDRSQTRQKLDELQASYVSVAQEPTLPMGPSNRNRSRNLVLVFCFAIFGSMGAAFVFDFMNRTLRTNDDVEKHLGLPVLVTVSLKDFKSCT